MSAKNSNQIRALRDALTERSINFTDFTDTMIAGNYAEQYDRTKAASEADREYFGICFLMNAVESRELTKRFSLYS